MYYKLINDDTKYDIKDIKELNEILNKEIVLEIDISNNQLTQLPECINDFINLQNFYCHCNKLTTLGELNLPNLQILGCHYNKLTTLGQLNLPNLQQLYCYNNQLTTLGQLNFPNLQTLNCINNNLTTLPLWLMNTRLNYINYANNAIDNLPLTLIRFINRIQQGSLNDINVYNDSQNIHNSSIQLTVKNSINKLSDKFRIKTFNLEELTNLILEDSVINCKERLIQYMANKEQHSLLLLNFAEILWLVWQEINQFEPDKQLEAKKRLNEEIKESECMCYTGRCNRLVNCLVGFSDLVEIKIQDSSQIGNIIVIVKERLGKEYTVDKHKEEVKKELLERGYDLETINEWIDYIE
jgi:hypothetical protein